MWHLRRAWRLVLVSTLAASVLGCTGGSDHDDWRRIGDVDFLLADDLPDGWVVSSATLRPGRPSSAWLHRTEAYADDSDAALFIMATDFTPPGVEEVPEGPLPGDPVDAEIDQLAYLLAYSGLGPHDGADARQIAWRSGTVSFTVVHLAPNAADDELLRAVADELATVRTLDFPEPDAIGEAGFRPASTLTELDDVADYTLMWAHRDDAGDHRGDDRPEGSPALWLNVGARMYVPLYARQGDLVELEEAEVVEEEGTLSLTFVRDGLVVDVGGQGVEPDVLLVLARSLRDVPFDRWEAELGERLLIDEPDPPDGAGDAAGRG